MPSEGDWRTAIASVAGSSHETSGLPCQDASACEVVVGTDGHRSLVATVCDGAGSARFAGLGAKEVCDASLGFGRRLVLEPPSDAASWTRSAQSFLEELQRRLDELAAARDVERREFATTLLLAVVGEAGAAFLQVGDGAMVVRPRDGADWTFVFWPQHGEFLNTTRFVTDPDVSDAVMLDWVEGRMADVALFSDGLERLLLHFHTRTVHAPFFERMFPPLWSAGDEPVEALRDRLSVGLAQYLRSETVRRHADDDLSLVLATSRRGPPPRTESPMAPEEPDDPSDPD